MTRKSPLLFEEFSGLEEKIPHRSFVQQTAVHKLKSLSAEVNANLWIKRDDQTTDIYGGNKPRKLEFVLADALAKGKSNVITIGGTGSNHCLATSIYAKQLNLNPILILFNQPITADVQKKLLIFQSLGAEILGPYSEVWGFFHYFLFSRVRKNTYFLPVGGSTPLGILGFVNAAFELKSQIENNEMPKPEYIFVTCGTMGTMAGLLLGCQLANLDSKIIGVRVVQKMVAYFNFTFSFANAVRKIARKTLKFLRKKESSIPKIKFKEKPAVIHDFYGGAYGRVTSEGVEAIELLKQHEDITLDTTYTGKTFAALLNFIKEHEIREAPVLFWNTYNSIDISNLKSPSITYKDLPKSFHKIFEIDIDVKLIDGVGY